MTAEPLPPCTKIVSSNEYRRTVMLDSAVSGLCAELSRVQGERDALAAENEELRRQLEVLTRKASEVKV